MAAEWFVQADGEQTGPLSPPELRRLVLEGRVTAETLVRLGADGKWIPAGRVRGLLPDATSNAPPDKSVPRPSAPVAPRGQTPPPAAEQPNSRRRLGREPSAMERPRPTPVATRPVAAPAMPAAPTAAFSAGLPAAPQPSKLLTGLGWASVSCGGLALLMAWSTEFMVVLTGIGILMAIAAIVWGIVRRRAGLGLPITGIVVCVGVLATVFAAKLIIGDRFSGSRRLESTNRRAPAEAVDLDQAESEWVQFENDTQWTRAERPALISNMEVRIEEVLFDHATLNDLGSEQQSQEPYFIVRISVRNSDRDRQVEYRSWSGAGALTDAGLAALTDRDGKSYPREDFGLGLRVADQVSAASLDPGESVEDLLIFKATGQESDVYRLELPGSAVGEDGAFRFAIPATMIRRIAD